MKSERAAEEQRRNGIATLPTCLPGQAKPAAAEAKPASTFSAVARPAPSQKPTPIKAETLPQHDGGHRNHQRPKPSSSFHVPPPPRAEAEPRTPTRNKRRVLIDDDRDAALTPPAVDPPGGKKIDRRIEEIMQQRDTKRREKMRDTQAKKILRASGLDFNNHFQKAHAGAQIENDHWREFKSCILGEADLRCRVCQDLIMKHCIQVAKFQTQGEQALQDAQGQRAQRGGRDGAPAPAGAPATAEAAAGAPAPDGDGAPAPDRAPAPESLAVVAADTIHPDVKRRKVGRPRKDAEDKFDLKQFLTQHRPKTYTFLTREDSEGHLAGDIAALFKKEDMDAKEKLEMKDQMVDEMMAKHPVFCNPCPAVMHFQCLTNDRQLLLGSCSYTWHFCRPICV